jgi:hypothetical protein
VDIKNAKNEAKTKKLRPKQDQGLICKETKARRAKPKKPGPNRKETYTVGGPAYKI